MKISKITKLTVTIDGDPGDRISGIDRDGYTIDSITLRWDGNNALRERLIDVIRAIREMDNSGVNTELEGEAYHNLHIDRSNIIDKVLTLPVYKSKRVWVGYNY
jgi:hypothetical protein